MYINYVPLFFTLKKRIFVVHSKSVYTNIPLFSLRSNSLFRFLFHKSPFHFPLLYQHTPPHSTITSLLISPFTFFPLHQSSIFQNLRFDPSWRIRERSKDKGKLFQNFENLCIWLDLFLILLSFL